VEISINFVLGEVFCAWYSWESSEMDICGFSAECYGATCVGTCTSTIALLYQRELLPQNLQDRRLRFLLSRDHRTAHKNSTNSSI